MAILEILEAAAAIAQVGATLYGGYKSNEATEKANKQNLALYERGLDQNLAAQKVSQKQTDRQIGLSEKLARLNKKQQDWENKRTTELDNVTRMQKAADKYAEMLNTGEVVRSSRMAGFQRG